MENKQGSGAVDTSDPTLGQKSPRALEILKRVQGKVTPVTPAQRPQDTTPKGEIPPVIETKPTSVSDTDIEYDIGEDKTQPKPQQKVETKTVVPDDLDPTDDIDALIDPRGSTKDNFYKLRTKLKSVNKASKEKESAFETMRTELEAATTRLKEYDDGIIVPGVVAEKDQRIAELEPYQKLYALESTPAYIETFVKPIEGYKESLITLAKEYGVDEGVLHDAYAAPTRADQNRILTKAFTDEMGALEAKTLLNNIKKLETEAITVKKDASKSLPNFEAESIRIANEKREKDFQVITTISKDAWTESLVTLREDERFSELSFIPGDTEHNEKYARPILTKAGQEYGRIVKALSDHGLTQLPKELGIAMSRMSQLAHLTAVKVHENEQLRNELNSLKNDIKAKNNLYRPGVSGTGNAPAARTQDKPSTPEGVGRAVLARVMNQK